MQKTTLAFHDFNLKQSENFAAILTLSLMSLHDNWDIVDINGAGVIFVASAKGLTHDQWDAIQKQYAGAILVAYSDTLAPLMCQYELLTKITKLPARSKLIVLLNQLALELAQKKLHVAAELLETERVANERLEKNDVIEDLAPIVSLNTRVESRFFFPTHYFLGILLESIASGRCYECKSACGSLLYVSSHQKKYFFSTKKTNLNELLLRSVDDFTVTELSPMDFEQTTKSMEPKKLNELLWSATVVGSQGRLMKGHGLDDVIHLKHWPDIAHIKATNHYLIIAAFMSRNTVDMKTIANQTEQTLADVIDFHNACDVLGLIERDDTFRLNSQPVSEKLRQLRGRIFETLHLNVVEE